MLAETAVGDVWLSVNDVKLLNNLLTHTPPLDLYQSCDSLEQMETAQDYLAGRTALTVGRAKIGRLIGIHYISYLIYSSLCGHVALEVDCFDS